MALHAWFRSPAPRNRTTGEPRVAVACVQVYFTCEGWVGQGEGSHRRWTSLEPGPRGQRPGCLATTWRAVSRASRLAIFAGSGSALRRR